MEKKIIKYEFCDGTVREYEVEGELYAVHEQLVKDEKRNHWRNTRRHVSLSYLNEHEIDIEAPDGDPLQRLIRREESEAIEGIFAKLSPDQRELLESVYTDGKTMEEIALSKGVDASSVRHRMMRIKKKIKKFL